jgi:hypothetical protein
VRQAKRAVLARCIYAVDLNPMAVELCKVSLWINASVQDRPLSFLDHHIKQGNSLIGATPELLEDGIPYEAFPTKSKSRSGDDGETSKAFREKTKTERKESKEGQGVQMGAFESAVTTEPRVAYEAGDFEQVAQEKPKQARQIYAEYEKDEERRRAKLEADMYTAAFFWPMPEGTDWAPTYGELFRLQREGPGAIPAEQRERIEEMADDYNFFHWHLEFPEVFGGAQTNASLDVDGGFDVVLGNPPWERIKLQQKEFFATKAPEIAGADTAAKREEMIEDLKENGDPLYDEFQRAEHFSEALSTYLRESGRYDLSAQGDINTYQIFAGLVRQVVDGEGRVGVIVPSGIATDYHTQDFFRDLIETKSLASLFEFENEGFFAAGQGHMVRFALTTIVGENIEVDDARFLFKGKSLGEIRDDQRRFTLSPEDISLINPNTLTCPIFENSRDAIITKKIYRSTPVLLEEGEGGGNHWGIRFFRIYDMATDSNLFNDKGELKESGLDQFGDRMRLDEAEYQPLYEGKMVSIFNHRYGDFGLLEEGDRGHVLPQVKLSDLRDPTYTIEGRHWVRKEKTEDRLSGNWNLNGLLGFRDVTDARASARTVVACLIPRKPAGHKIPFVLPSNSNAVTLLALYSGLTSFSLDYVARQKVGGLSLSYHYLKQFPVHPPDRYTPELLQYIVPRVMELTYTAWDLAAFADDVWNESGEALQSAIEAQWQDNVQATGGGHRGAQPPAWVEHSDQANEEFPHAPFMWDEERRRFLRAELDALYGHLYGLSHDELDYILETFPIVKKQDIEDFGDYRTKKLILHCFDQLEEATEQGKAYDPILDLPAIELGDIRPESEHSGDETIDESTHASTPSA